MNEERKTDYVSFETTKLLNERGFNEDGFLWYAVNDGEIGEYNITDRSRNPEWFIQAPTLQMAMKWLRKVHNLVIEPYRTACGYLYTISRLPFGSTCYDNGSAYNGDDEDSGQWTTWEKACEDGIRYCLEKLI